MNFKSLKKVVFGLMACIMLLCMSGVSVVQAKGVSADTYLKKMNKAFSKVKSYDVKYSFPIDMSLVVKVDEYEQKTDSVITTKINQTVVNSPKLMAKTTLTQTSKEGDTTVKNTKKIYLKTDSDDNVVAYAFLNDIKTPNKMILSASDVSSLIKSADTSALLNTKVVNKNYNLNGKKVIKLTAEVNCKNMTDLVKSLPSDTSDVEGNDKFIDDLLSNLENKTIKFTYYIDKKTYLPVKITSDLGSFLEEYMNSLLTSLNASMGDDTVSVSSKVTMNKASTTMTFSGFNKTKTIKFPSSCK